jgi:putative membrane protein
LGNLSERGGMNRLFDFLVWLFLFLVFLASVGFAVINTEEVYLSVGFAVFGPHPFSVWVIIAFVLGGLTGLVLGAGIFRVLRLRIEIRRLRARAMALDKELAVLKAAQGKSGESAVQSSIIF